MRLDLTAAMGAALADFDEYDFEGRAHVEKIVTAALQNVADQFTEEADNLPRTWDPMARLGHSLALKGAADAIRAAIEEAGL